MRVAEALMSNASARVREHPDAMPAGLCKWPSRATAQQMGPSMPPPLSVRMLVMSLPAVSGHVRAQWLRANQEALPSLHPFRAVDGGDIEETLGMLDALKVPFQQLCDRHASWGMLANTLTRIAALERQVADREPVQAVLEDDVALGRGFAAHVGQLAAAARMHVTTANVSSPHVSTSEGKRTGSGQEFDLVQLGAFGEGYLTSLRGAKLLLQAFRKHGIHGCPDQQLNDASFHRLAGIKALRSTRWTPWVLLVTTNEGQIGRSRCISKADTELLRWASRRGTQLRVNRTAILLVGHAPSRQPAARPRVWGCCAYGDVPSRDNARKSYKAAVDFLYAVRRR